jgi:hypothetical protein
MLQKYGRELQLGHKVNQIMESKEIVLCTQVFIKKTQIVNKIFSDYGELSDSCISRASLCHNYNVTEAVWG